VALEIRVPFRLSCPKGINPLGLDERKRLYRISGEILAVERAQKEMFFNFLQIQVDFARNFLTFTYNYAHMHIYLKLHIIPQTKKEATPP
jgi:hypothetical protein